MDATKTYTIKPLVLVDDGNGGFVCHRGQHEYRMYNRKGWWRWHVELRGSGEACKCDGKRMMGAPRDREQAVASLNDAYRKLIAEHLEEVK